MAGRKLSLTVVLFFLALVVGARYWPLSAQGSTQAQSVDFVRDIQPIFQAHCAKCHGTGRAMAGLRLDSRAEAMRTITPGRSRESLLLKRILGEGGQERMPRGGPPLSAAQIDLVRRWIDEGANWPDTAAATAKGPTHWAYVAPVRPPLPETKNKVWAVNPIDRFTLARLEKEGLAPSRPTDRVTLLRRLSLDLIGLPPTVEEVDAFVNDRSPEAEEKQIARLLASPHYGERWGRQWLDAARYADSDGYEKDKSRQVWFYRDWVINAFNRDLPYDRFIIEQIAGDLLPQATQEQIVATGFLRNSMINEEGGVDPEQFRMEAMFDRIDAIGKSVLGLTIQCAQCHNHKYDPLRHEEYYRLFAFLNNANESQLSVYTPGEEMKRAEIFRRTREIEAELQHRAPDWEAKMARWEKLASSDRPSWKILQPTVNDISTGGQRYIPLPDSSFLAQGYAPTQHRVKLIVKTDEPLITGFRLEMLTDPNLPMGGPGRSIKGMAALTEFEVEAATAEAPDKPTKLKIARATADIEQSERELEAIFDDRSNHRRVTGPIKFAIDGVDETAWGIDAGPGRRNQPRQAVFMLAEPLKNTGGLTLNFYLKQNHGGWNSNDNQSNNLGRFRLALTSTPDPSADPVPAAVREIIAIPREQRTPAQQQTVFGYWRTTVSDWKDANVQIDGLWREHPEGTSQLVLTERREMRPTHLLQRGDFLRPDKAVVPGVPSYLHALPKDAPADRLTFARWLVDRRSPTSARAVVNRIWQSYFGTGLVSTPEDFGKQGERPSHQELLDWLAVELMENGWSLKHLHRLIVSSATYQ
jgi:mono/diheme cytochrome c family protein